MKSESLRDLIIWCEEHDACSDAVAWLKARKGTAQQAWKDCPRGDWLLWLAEEREVSWQKLVLCSCDCARRVLRFVLAGEDSPRLAVEAAERWAKDPSEENKNAAWAAGAAARSAAGAAAWAAEAAAWAAAEAAADAAEGAAADAAAWAAGAAARSAAGAAAEAARSAELQTQADMIRKRIPHVPLSSRL